MFTPGLVSVTFRPLGRLEITEWMQKCGLTAVEWGGDVHVPAKDPSAIADAVTVSREHGIEIVSYGSYYRAGVTTEETTAAFSDELAATVALGAPNIRIWAGTKGRRHQRGAEGIHGRHSPRMPDRSGGEQNGQSGVSQRHIDRCL